MIGDRRVYSLYPNCQHAVFYGVICICAAGYKRRQSSRCSQTDENPFPSDAHINSLLFNTYFIGMFYMLFGFDCILRTIYEYVNMFYNIFMMSVSKYKACPDARICK